MAIIVAFCLSVCVRVGLSSLPIGSTFPGKASHALQRPAGETNAHLGTLYTVQGNCDISTTTVEPQISEEPSGKKREVWKVLFPHENWESMLAVPTKDSHERFPKSQNIGVDPPSQPGSSTKATTSVNVLHPEGWQEHQVLLLLEETATKKRAYEIKNELDRAPGLRSNGPWVKAEGSSGLQSHFELLATEVDRSLYKAASAAGINAAYRLPDGSNGDNVVDHVYLQGKKLADPTGAMVHALQAHSSSNPKHPQRRDRAEKFAAFYRRGIPSILNTIGSFVISLEEALGSVFKVRQPLLDEAEPTLPTHITQKGEKFGLDLELANITPLVKYSARKSNGALPPLGPTGRSQYSRLVYEINFQSGIRRIIILQLFEKVEEAFESIKVALLSWLESQSDRSHGNKKWMDIIKRTTYSAINLIVLLAYVTTPLNAQCLNQLHENTANFIILMKEMWVSFFRNLNSQEHLPEGTSMLLPQSHVESIMSIKNKVGLPAQEERLSYELFSKWVEHNYPNLLLAVKMSFAKGQIFPLCKLLGDCAFVEWIKYKNSI